MANAFSASVNVRVALGALCVQKSVSVGASRGVSHHAMHCSSESPEGGSTSPSHRHSSAVVQGDGSMGLILHARSVPRFVFLYTMRHAPRSSAHGSSPATLL